MGGCDTRTSGTPVYWVADAHDRRCAPQSLAIYMCLRHIVVVVTACGVVAYVCVVSGYVVRVACGESPGSGSYICSR